MPAHATSGLPDWFLFAVVALLAVIAVAAVVALLLLWSVAQQLDQRASLNDKLQILMDKGDIEAVIKQCKERLSLFPEDATAHYYLGFALYRDGQSKLALGHLKRVPELQAGWDVSALLAAVERAAANTEKPADLRLVKDQTPLERERGDA
jgi:cytochrome c-type biogenesis protein CcmH/NrfG